jgi:hypothetical protein
MNDARKGRGRSGGQTGRPGSRSRPQTSTGQSGSGEERGIRRDAQGRLARVVDLLGIALAGLVIGVLVLLLFDGMLSIIGWGKFGQVNGWPAAVLPVWFFVEDFRAWRDTPSRVVAAGVAAAVALALGLLAAGLTAGLPPLASSGLGVLVGTVGYVLIWFYGVRWLDAR